MSKIEISATFKGLLRLLNSFFNLKLENLEISTILVLKSGKKCTQKKKECFKRGSKLWLENLEHNYKESCGGILLNHMHIA